MRFTDLFFNRRLIWLHVHTSPREKWLSVHLFLTDWKIYHGICLSDAYNSMNNFHYASTLARIWRRKQLFSLIFFSRQSFLKIAPSCIMKKKTTKNNCWKICWFMLLFESTKINHFNLSTPRNSGFVHFIYTVSMIISLILYSQTRHKRRTWRWKCMS